MSEIIELLLANLDAAYLKRGWHGPTVKNALRGVTAEEALRRPAEGRHNIWELAAHMAYWKYIARRRLRGAKAFPLRGSNWFASPEVADEREWRALIDLLDSEHRLLRETIESLSDAELRNSKKLRLVYGVAAHDVYHAGQLQLVRKLTQSR